MKPKPTVVQLSRQKGFNLQFESRALNGLPAINVARPSRFGNPIKVGGYFRLGKGWVYCQALSAEHSVGFTLIENRKMAMEWFRKMRELTPLRKEDIEELRGKNLACWCGDADCHAWVLLEIANND